MSREQAIPIPLHPLPVEDDGTAEVMRQLRNEGAGGFAHFQGQISEAEQRHWWAANRERVRAWLFYARRDEQPATDPDGYDLVCYDGLIGYGMVRRDDDGRWWDSLAVTEAMRGYGYGAAIVRFLVRACPGPLYSEILQTNAASLRAHPRGEWDAVRVTDRTVVLQAKKGSVPA